MLTVKPWWTRTLPLNDGRDVMARIGFRCVWCTIPYFALALLCAALGKPVLLLNPFAAIPLIVPVAGGVLDWLRVRAMHKPQ